MQDTLKIGIAVKPQGVRGEIKIRPLTDNVERFNDLKQVIIDGSETKVASIRICGADIFITLFGVTDRTTAEKFRGKFLCVKREDAVKLKNDEFFIADLVGLSVLRENGEEIGKIIEIVESKTDIIRVKANNGEILAFPFLKKILVSVDIIKGEMIVNNKIDEVICSEN